MCDLINLLFPRCVNARIRVPDADGKNSAETIEIFAALIVPNVFALASDERKRLLVISCHGRKKKFLVLLNCTLQRRLCFWLGHKNTLNAENT